jgi:hypothetical protein
MASTWTSSDPLWQSLSDHQKVAAMALMEAGKRNVNDAVNAASAMVNRSQKTEQPLGEHVSGRVYQPTFEPNQHARLPGIVQSPQFGALTDWVAARAGGQIPDTVGGATHFLAKPDVMLSLESQNPSKYRNWGPRGANWTGYDPATGQYANQTMEDSSHAFLAPEGRYIAGNAEPSSSAMADSLKARLEQTVAAKDASGTPVSVDGHGSLPLVKTAQAPTGTSNDARPGAMIPTLPSPPDEARAALSKALMDEAAGNKPRNALELLGSLAQYTSGAYGVNKAVSEGRDYKQKFRDAMLEAQTGGDRKKLLGILAQNPETQGAALSAMLADTGPKSAPEVKDLITNPLTQEKSSFTWNPATSKWEPISIPGASQQQNASGLSGDDLLKSIDQGTAKQVKAMVEGRMKFPGSFALKTPYWQNMIRLASQYDPGFDENVFRVRSDTRQDAESTKGKTNQTIVAANTAIGHLGQLSDLAEKLDNYSNAGVLNAPMNWARNAYKSTSQDPSLTNFNTVRDKYVEEATKFYRGSGGNEADLKRDIENLQVANSPQQLREAIAYHAKLMQSKISAVSEEYGKVMGKPLDIIHPESQAALDRITQRLDPLLASIPPDAIEMLKNHPETAGHFDQTFGKGGSQPSKAILGSPAPAAPTPDAGAIAAPAVTPPTPPTPAPEAQVLPTPPVTVPPVGSLAQPQQPTQLDPLSQARAAISAGAPRDAVIDRLKQIGIDPSGL